MNFLTIFKKNWYIALIALITPIIIGIVYRIFYGYWCHPEWGAISTWFVGIFSIVLLYKTLITQNYAIKESRSQLSLQLLRENIIFMLRILKENLNATTGRYSYVDKRFRIVKNNHTFKGNQCFYALFYEIKMLRNILLGGKRPPKETEAMDEYDNLMTEFSKIEEEYANLGETMSEEELKRKETISNTYLSAILLERYNINDKYWEQKATENELDSMIESIIFNVHPEFLPFLKVLSQIYKSIEMQTNLRGYNQETKQIMLLIENSLTDVQKKLFDIYLRVTK